METLVTTCKEVIHNAITDFLLDRPNLKFRYEFSYDEDLHLIEVSPSNYSNEPFIVDFDLYLTKKVSDIDLHQSVVVFPANDIDFAINNCEIVLEGLLYSESDRKSKVIQLIFKSRTKKVDGLNIEIQSCDYDYSSAA